MLTARDALSCNRILMLLGPAASHLPDRWSGLSVGPMRYSMNSPLSFSSKPSLPRDGGNLYPIGRYVRMLPESSSLEWIQIRNNSLGRSVMATLFDLYAPRKVVVGVFPQRSEST